MQNGSIKIGVRDRCRPVSGLDTAVSAIWAANSLKGWTRGAEPVEIDRSVFVPALRRVLERTKSEDAPLHLKHAIRKILVRTASRFFVKHGEMDLRWINIILSADKQDRLRDTENAYEGSSAQTEIAARIATKKQRFKFRTAISSARRHVTVEAKKHAERK